MTPVSVDLYAGPLTRYLAGDWVTRLPAGVEHHPPPADALTDPQRLRQVVLRWREALASGLRGHGVELEWAEAADGAYTAERIGAGWGAVLLLAAYDERPELSGPDDAPALPGASLAVRAVAEPAAHSRYPALVKDVLWWLPARFPFGFEAPTPSGARLRMASVDALGEQLDELDRRTLRLGSAPVAPPADAPSREELAAWGLHLLLRGAAAAAGARLPLLLDL